MSWWGTIDARFTPSETDKGHLAKNIEREIKERDQLAPTGSESGPDVVVLGDEKTVLVQGNMRDVNDKEDAAMILAWFVHNCRWCQKAEIQFEFDSGPRYRYEWDGGKLIKLKGCLDL